MVAVWSIEALCFGTDIVSVPSIGQALLRTFRSVHINSNAYQPTRLHPIHDIKTRLLVDHLKIKEKTELESQSGTC